MAETKKTEKTVQEVTAAGASASASGMESITGFIKKYQVYFIGGLVAVLGIVAFLMLRGGGSNSDKESKAQRDMLSAARYIQSDSFNLALKGDTSGAVGLESIIKKYKGTHAAKEAMLQAAWCYLNLGDTKKALENLENASGFGKQLEARRLSLLGDAYSTKGTSGASINKSDCEKAAGYYLDAVDKFADDDINAAQYLMKLAQLHELMGNTAKAAEAYKTIKEKYPATPQNMQVEKYLGKAGVEN